MKQTTYSREANKALNRMPANTARTIMGKIDQYARDPTSLTNNVKTLSGRFAGLVRLRVGDWRVIMDDSGVVLLILSVNPRGGAYD